ncbi:class I SAM-dependent methyltransferase [Wenzhouxiangella sp. AB-CW3]|uniref:class I SAM-dependent methyltransferase n=1 Tax=Wenzhouxiangella sp. AB-CW3 TaxID=2771012 RepID=UPI00168B5665|nr:class I SAM-dependent methyltransferase [Wenzhouxiangella sp. AB-CW3]QOC23130.1 class I SAM-dependent methyltransferase [Wenzhouxiangella sp. AB-CW3]
MSEAPAFSAEIQRARELESNDPDEAGRLYMSVLERDPGNLEASNALERLHDPRRYSAWMRINCMIDPRDDIFRFIGTGPYSHNPIRDYLADGWRTLSELMVVMDKLDRPLTRVSSFLEFASGYGRFTRHLVKVLPGKVACSDVMPGAMEFAREQFGVEAFYSSFEPEEIEFPRRYEVVFVLSLLTHLPIEVWGRWLKAWAGAVAPGGVLIFTVHNEDVLRNQLGVEFDETGYSFLPSSESPSLEANQYGTSLATASVVAEQIRLALGTDPVLWEECAFWVGHDAIAIRPHG